MEEQLAKHTTGTKNAKQQDGNGTVEVNNETNLRKKLASVELITNIEHRIFCQ